MPKPLTVWITTNWCKILKEISIPNHLTCLLRNLYGGQEATVRTGHGAIDLFQIGKGVCQDCVFSSYLKVGGEGDDRGWDGWMESPTQWTWVWVSKSRELVMDREAWHAVVHGVAKSQTQLNDWTDLNWGASLVAQTVKPLLTMRETWVRSLGLDDPLEKGMATHSSIHAWKIPLAKEPSELQSMGLQRVRHDWVTSLHFTSKKQKTYI